MKKVILLIFLTIVIANAISFHVGNSSNIKLNSLFEVFEANAETGSGWDCWDKLREYDYQCPIGSEREFGYEDDYWVFCVEDANGGYWNDVSCHQYDYQYCDGTDDYGGDCW